MGDVRTPEQCKDMLAKKLPRYDKELMACVKVPISTKEHIAYLSGSYNFGTSAFCKSSIAKKLNAGDHVGACDALLLYDHTRSSGKVKGLTNRRKAENKLCLEGVTDKPTPSVGLFDRIRSFFAKKP